MKKMADEKTETTEKKTFKQKIIKVLAIAGSFLGTFLIGYLVKLITGNKPTEAEAQQKVEESITQAKQDAENLQANVDVLQQVVDEAKQTADLSPSTEDRLDKLEQAGMITRKKKDG
jgi:uncharacterized protein YlxW (UPF0749 family)